MKARKICICLSTFKKIFEFALAGGMPKNIVKRIPLKGRPSRAKLLGEIRPRKKRRTAKQRAATRRLVAFNKRRRR